MDCCNWKVTRDSPVAGTNKFLDNNCVGKSTFTFESTNTPLISKITWPAVVFLLNVFPFTNIRDTVKLSTPSPGSGLPLLFLSINTRTRMVLCAVKGVAVGVGTAVGAIDTNGRFAPERSGLIWFAEKD